MVIYYIIAQSATRCLILCGLFIFIGALPNVLFLDVDHGSEGVRQFRVNAREGIDNRVSPSRACKKENRDAARNVIYVLGGTQHSLSVKCRTAAKLYQKGGIEKIVVGTSAGITVYNKDIGRNLTNDEWTVTELCRQGVETKAVSFIKLKDSLFGTLGEARTLREICLEKGIGRLLLVCSAYHSRRVSYLFATILENTGVRIEICPVDEQVGLREHFVEKAKFIFYKYAFIPSERLLGNLY
jgi:uncharacterized SAM-binding protein YcdF (DUF218 family)